LEELSVRQWLVIAGCAGVLAMADVAAAQRSIVRGGVVDENGDPVADASVTFHDAANDRTFTSESGKNGDYVIMVPSGMYQVTVEKDGYRGSQVNQQIRWSDAVDLEPMKIVSMKSLVDARMAEINSQFQKAGALANEGKLDEAVAVFEALLESHPNIADIHYNLGLLHVQQEEWGPAIASLEKAIELKPDHGAAALALAGAYEKSGRGDEAAARIEQAARENADDPQVQLTAAYFYLNANRNEEALPFLERWRELQPENAEVHYLLATVATGQGDFARAVPLLERFLELADEDDQYRASAEAILPQLKEGLAQGDGSEPQ
jgi:tetratricopeptide (TPR) repeat protein